MQFVPLLCNIVPLLSAKSIKRKLLSKPSTQFVQLMRPAFLAPFPPAMDACGLDTDEILAASGLSRKAILLDTGMVSAQQVHQFVRSAAKASGNPWFCWETSWKVNLKQYPMFSDLISRNLTLGEGLTKLAISSASLASASSFELHIDGAYCRFLSRRLYRSGPLPHTDTVVAGLLVLLLKDDLGKHCNLAEVAGELGRTVSPLRMYRFPWMVAAGPSDERNSNGRS